MHSKRPMARFLITAGLLLAFLQAFDWLSGAYNTRYSDYVASAEAAKSVPAISMKELDKRLQRHTKHKLVFLYASWCPHCRKQKPVIEQLKEEYKNRLDVVFIAVNRDINKLATYLSQNPSSITTYRIAADEIPAFQAWLASTGSNYNGGIPHSMIIGKNGKLIDEVTGFIPYEGFKQGLDKLL